MGDPPVVFAAAVLTGGASRRMGRDKAAIEIDGVGMAERVIAALLAAGAVEVARIGDVIPDLHPGAGPLGGVLTALRWSDEQVTVVAPCDLLTPDADSFNELVAALLGASALAAVPSADRPLPVALRAAAAEPLAAAFAAGERSLRGGLAGLDTVCVALSPGSVADADTPDELPPSAR